MEAAAVKSRKPAFIAALLLGAGLLVSASKSPTREECQAFIERESQQRCQTTLSSAWTWLQDMLFAEGRYMRMRDEAIAKREHDLVRKKVERGELPREALNQRSYKSAVQQQTTQQQQRQSSLLTRIWNELFAESRYIQQRNEAIAARQRDLEQVKHDRGDSRHESDKTPLKKTKTNIAQKPSSTKATPPKPHKPVSTAKKVSADPRRLYTTTTTATTTTTSKNNWLYDIVFAEANYMKLRDEAIENRQRDLIKTKIARGELPEKALDSKTWSVTPKKHFLGVSKDYDDEEAQNQERAHSLWDMIFSERRLMEIRRKAMAERQLDLIRTKVERGELPQEALENPELYDTETSGEDEDEEQLSLWDMIFSEARLMRIRQKAMTERRRDLIRQKVESGQLPREALEWNPEEIDNEDADTGFFPSLWDAIFADGRHYEIRQQALAERRLDLIRTKVERGELPTETLEEAYADMDKLYDTDDQGDGQQSILARIWNELFAESRYWEQRNKAIAEREADLRRLKMAQAGHADIETPTMPLKKKSQPASSQHKQKAAAIKPSPETTRTPEKTVISSQTPSAKTPTSTTKTKPNRQPVDKPQSTTTTHVPTVQSPAYQPPPPHAEPTVRSRQQVERLMGLNEPQMRAVDDAGAYTLRQLKGIADSCVRPLEELYKYSEISSRTLGEAELNAKSMLLFLGQLNSGKSTMINYLLGTQPTKTTALPGSGQFRILSYGERDEKQNGAQVASKWEFSGLQKFGEGFLERLSGRQMKNKLLEKANIVDVPGVMEGRQYNRLYPFNDVCQWLIDRADMIFVVFDPHHLDIGIEMENLLDQLKGRETQVRILLNKADQLAASDLLRVQTSLIWTLSPLIGSSTAPPIFSGSFIEHTAHSDTSHQLMFGSQEEALLRDIGSGLARRVANKIALTRRHAVRVRNHARMVDCYLTTYLNQITFLSNKKRLAEDIVGNPHKYHIYEGISRMNNISRYDLPDPELYEEFFAMHALYEFPTLQSTCTFFKGCPLDTIDTAIQHTLPDLLGQYRKTTAKSAPGAKRS